MSGALPVTLGGLLLTGAAVPSFYDHVGRMRTAVHNVIGGGRVVQTLGVDPQKRQLSGCFIGPDASDNGLLLEAMRDAGVPLVLTIGAWTELVLLTIVSVRYSDQGSVAPYYVEAEPVNVNPTDSVATTTSIIANVAADIARSAGSLVVGQTADGSVTPVQHSLMTAAKSVSQGGGSSLPALAGASSNLQAIVTNCGAATTAINARAPSGSLILSSSELGTAGQVLLLLASAVQASGYLNRANSALTELSGTVALPLLHA